MTFDLWGRLMRIKMTQAKNTHEQCRGGEGREGWLVSCSLK